MIIMLVSCIHAIRIDILCFMHSAVEIFQQHQSVEFTFHNKYVIPHFLGSPPRTFDGFQFRIR